jgi:hypothetical protein
LFVGPTCASIENSVRATFVVMKSYGVGLDAIISSRLKKKCQSF